MPFLINLFFQTFLLIGSTFTIKPMKNQGGRLPISIQGCYHSLNLTTLSSKINEKFFYLIKKKKTDCLSSNSSPNILNWLFTISPTWFVSIGTIITILFGWIFSFILGKKDFF